MSNSTSVHVQLWSIENIMSEQTYLHFKVFSYVFPIFFQLFASVSHAENLSFLGRRHQTHLSVLSQHVPGHGKTGYNKFTFDRKCQVHFIEFLSGRNEPEFIGLI